MATTGNLMTANLNTQVATAVAPLSLFNFNRRVKRFFRSGIQKPFGNCYEERYVSGWYSGLDGFYRNFEQDRLARVVYGADGDFLRRTGWAYGYAYEATDPARRGNMDFSFVVIGEIGPRALGTRLDQGKATCVPFEAELLDRIALRMPTMASESLAQSFNAQLSRLGEWRAAEDRDIAAGGDDKECRRSRSMLDCMDSVEGTIYIHLPSEVSTPPDIFIHNQSCSLQPVEYASAFRPGIMAVALVTPVNWTAGSLKVRTLTVKALHLLCESPEPAEQHGKMADVADILCSVHLDHRRESNGPIELA